MGKDDARRGYILSTKRKNKLEFNEKLQELRRKKGITQEELASALFVSRTAISKWESGRGYPSIESLKAIAKYFSVTLDELLSGEELLTAAEEDGKRREGNIRDLMFGLLDIGIALLLFLPFFAERTGDAVYSVSLISLDGIQPYLKLIYLSIVALTTVFGVVTLALQACQAAAWLKCKGMASLILSIVAVALFTVSLQPYASIFTFALLVIKALMLIKRR